MTSSLFILLFHSVTVGSLSVPLPLAWTHWLTVMWKKTEEVFLPRRILACTMCVCVCVCDLMSPAAAAAIQSTGCPLFCSMQTKKISLSCVLGLQLFSLSVNLVIYFLSNPLGLQQLFSLWINMLIIISIIWFITVLSRKCHKRISQ